MVDRQVRSDTGQPRAERPHIILRRLEPKQQQNLLQEVLGRSFVADDADQLASDLPGITATKQLERSGVPSLQTTQQFLVGFQSPSFLLPMTPLGRQRFNQDFV